jgi:hypothetical protein
MKEEFYFNQRDELLAQREKIRSLTKHPKIQGDYNEALIRNLVRRNIEKDYTVRHGLIYDEVKDMSSSECDVIVFDGKNAPLLEFPDQDLVVVNPNYVKFVMQVKSKLTSKTLQDAIKNLKSVKLLNDQIMCAIIGFETDVLLKTLYLNAWKSKVVQFLSVFKSDRRENRKLLGKQLRLFVELIRYYGKSGLHSYTRNLILKIDEKGSIILENDKSEEEIKSILSEIYSKGIENSNTSG